MDRMSAQDGAGKRGRKPTGVRRVRFQVSCQAEELAALRRLARTAGKTLSRYVIDSALLEAAR